MGYKVVNKFKLTKNVNIIITDNHRCYIRWYGADLINFKKFKDTFNYRMRVNKHMIVEKTTKWIVKRIAMYLLRKQYKAADAENCYYNRPKIIENFEPVDFYPACHNKHDKKYCHQGALKWSLHFRDLRLLAHSEYGLYLEVIRRFIIEPCRFPFC